MPKGQPPNFIASAWNCPISESGSKDNSLFRHADRNWVIIMGNTIGNVLFDPVSVSRVVEIYLLLGMK